MANMQLPVYNKQGKKSGSLEVADDIFGLKWNAALVHQVVVSQMANRRPPVAHTKDRKEVKGGGRKPWRQKGTGRARHGSIRSPIWRGGGITHGPRKERKFEKKVNRKTARKALFTILSQKAREQEIVVLEDLKFSELKTKEGEKLFSNLEKNAGTTRIKKSNGALVALAPDDREAKRVLRNLEYVELCDAASLNAYDVLRYRYLVLAKKGLEILSNMFAKKS